MGRILALVGASLILGSCGSAQPDSLAAAAARTRDAGSSAVRWTVESKKETFSLIGELDYRTGTGELVFGAVGEFRMVDGLKVRFANDGKTYVRYPESAEFASDDFFKEMAGKWMRLPEDEKGLFGSDQFLAMLVPLPGLETPQDILGLLDFARGGIEREDEVDLDGVATDHYRTRLDVARLLRERKTESTPNEVVEFLREIDELPLEAWIDESGRARRIVLRFPAVDDEPAGTLTVDFNDFGRTVDAAPPADKELLPDVDELLEDEAAGK